MRDKDGFIIKCKYSDWRIVDRYDNKDDVCTCRDIVAPGYILKGCYGDEKCPCYEPKVKEDASL